MAKYEEDMSKKCCSNCGRFLTKAELIDGLCEKCYKELIKREHWGIINYYCSFYWSIRIRNRYLRKIKEKGLAKPLINA